MRVLLSVYDKTGLDGLRRGPGRARATSSSPAAARPPPWPAAGIPHVTVESVTAAPEMLGGRVKTLHPRLHGGILADRSKPDHLADLERQGIEPIGLVVCNLYPFRSEPVDRADRRRRPDHGAGRGQELGPRRASVVDPADYGAVLDELRRDGRAVRRPAPAAGRGRLRPHRRLRRGHRQLVREPEGRPDAARDDPPVAGEGPDPPLRREPPPAGRPLPGDRAATAGGTTWSSTAGWRCPTSTSTTPTRPGGWSTSWPTSARPRRSWSSTPTRAGRRWPTTCSPPTTGRSSATPCRPSAASWP